MKIKLLLFLAIAIGCIWGCKTVKKLESKTKQGLENGLNRRLGTNQGSSTNTAGIGGPGSSGMGSGGAGGSGSSGNSGGAGLVSTPPNVKQNLKDAEDSYNKSSFSDARYSVQQAMLGVELEIGNQILNSYPASVSGLSPSKTQDQVTSTGFGWAGLTIHRVYKNSSGRSREFEITVANNAAWMSALNIYFNNAGYAQSGGQQNWKQIKYKGNRAIIEFSSGSGYKLSAPIGQSSLIVLNGISFDTEADMMDACNTIDVDGIKKMLGEQ